jgi:acetyl-CoA synthetase
MTTLITTEQLLAQDIPIALAADLAAKINSILTSLPPESAWHVISKEILTAQHPFELHYLIFKSLFPAWPEQLDSAPAWIPEPDSSNTTNLAKLMQELDISDVKALHRWSTNQYQDFWQAMLTKLNIQFHQPPKEICNLANGIESPCWLYGATLNIADSCFNAPADKTAIIYKDNNAEIKTITYAELNKLSNQIANSLIKIGFSASDAIAINMPMNPTAVAIYLGIIKMGAVVVSIADSFSAEEIAVRLQITHAKAIFTQDTILRDHKIIPLYNKVVAANAPIAIVTTDNKKIDVTLRDGDMDWQSFLSENIIFSSISCRPMDHCNILFSSGTTGTPKAIPWNHTTPIKAASDGYLHQNIQANDIIAWPTNLGWMMGPWLVFAGLINQATIALYTDTPQTRAFGEFIQHANVTILGVVPTLVAHWRQSNCMQGLNWSTIKLFSSTGECSNPIDMLYLMSLAHYKPIIEYCGGTEIGGAYITSTVCEKNYPSVFTTPAMGINFIIINEHGDPADTGEVALIPPSIGLSTDIVNANHHEVYFANMPHSSIGYTLRRHGDQLQRLSHAGYAALGRADDTMNIGGIKISSTEIERVLAGITDIVESAAVGITMQKQGPSSLVIFSVIGKQTTLTSDALKQEMQSRINKHLNPLFKIHELVMVRELPKTASNKIMRRKLRDEYLYPNRLDFRC